MRFGRSWERLLRPTAAIAMGRPDGPVMEAPEHFGLVYDPIETLAYVAGRRRTPAHPAPADAGDEPALAEPVERGEPTGQ